MDCWSLGATFFQSYGIKIQDFIQEHLPEDQVAVGAGMGADGTLGISAIGSYSADAGLAFEY